MSPMQTLVSDRLRTATERDVKGVADARKMLDVAYGWLEEQLTLEAWACGSTFSLAVSASDSSPGSAASGS